VHGKDNTVSVQFTHACSKVEVYFHLFLTLTMYGIAKKICQKPYLIMVYLTTPTVPLPWRKLINSKFERVLTKLIIAEIECKVSVFKRRDRENQLNLSGKNPVFGSMFELGTLRKSDSNHSVIEFSSLY
jgi:hypothetical protein